MRLEQKPQTSLALKVSTRLITSSTILHLSADEFEQTITQEQTENSVLEVTERPVCLFCGAPLSGQSCTVCGQYAAAVRTVASGEGTYEFSTAYEQAESSQLQASFQHASYDIDNDGFQEGDMADEYDPLLSIATEETLAEVLLAQLEGLISPDDAPIAEHLVGNLDERGYLEVQPQEIACYLQVPLKRVEYVLSQLQTLEPLGIGARDLRECLLIQLRALSEPDAPPSLVYTLIDTHLDLLVRNSFAEIARQLKASEEAVRHASQYIGNMLYPYPAYIYQASHRTTASQAEASYLHPDVLIRKDESGFEVSLIEEERYNFHITTYSDLGEQQSAERKNRDLQRYMQHHRDRAKFFVECVYRRWRTLKRVAELIVDYQSEFLKKGVRFLRPLTRAQVAAQLNLDEGTVSRATANKYALLPGGRLIPFSDFFDGSLCIKDRIREMIQHEDTRHRLSDDEIARLLTARGIPLARRTVTKYREEMNIGSSRERGNYFFTRDSARSGSA